MLPWDYDAELTADRLTKIASLLAVGRRDAVERHDPSIGDNRWTLGVCAYSFARHRIAEAAGTAGFEWLSVVDSGARFVFKIGARPMRFWRGNPHHPGPRVSCPTPMEQLRLDFGAGDDRADVLFRIGVIEDDEGVFVQACFVALLNREPETVWPIPLDRVALPLVAVDHERSEGRELPPPSVGLHEDAVEAPHERQA
ncbi:hypothetical protein [Lichenibacterium ramalinae]|uniref:Uncharacterized protein n=1 Tax=Lichenibacterium ramalinae TaxID=2316527 RepID=A0A4Q2RDD1_9HYPH|nr:hypothetical protein [Lichenibacterium ramalinae]RYB04333.1 hypothetical protein D3272_12805 [Lichenibacterium ramalinae]